MIRTLLSLLLWPVAAVVLVSSLYVAALTIFAAVARVRARAPAPPDRPSTRFAILVPAHNEEALLGRLLESLRDLDYPRHLLDVYVIADNCEDDTERVARAAGVRVLSRRDRQRRGKGYALAWALRRLRLRDYNAVVMVDADSVVAPKFLSAMDARLAAGEQALQGYYGVLDASSSASGLRALSFSLMHYVRPLGKSLFGGSCGLRGNGMAFSTDLLKAAGWQSFSVVEDAEQHLRLAEMGYRVGFVPGARVLGEMPTSLAGAHSQNLRWEAGRWMIARRWSLPILWRGMQRRSLALVDAAVEPLVPPLSVVAAMGAAVGLSGAALGSRGLAVAGAVSLSGLAAHVVGGMLVARAPITAWRGLLAAPPYVLWKVVLYGRALLGGGGQDWVRTPRERPSGRAGPR